MASKGSFRELLENIREAHEAHRRVYKAARSKYGTNRKAHEATAKELEEFHRTLRLLNQTLAPLEKPFLAGDHSAVNEIISFLEADVAAFRSGYSKERYYRKLKSLKLSSSQIGAFKKLRSRDA
jgi:glutathione S-transferase